MKMMPFVMPAQFWVKSVHISGEEIREPVHRVAVVTKCPRVCWDRVHVARPQKAETVLAEVYKGVDPAVTQHPSGGALALARKDLAGLSVIVRYGWGEID